MTLSSVGPLPLLVQPQAPPIENLWAGATAARFELAIDGHVLVSHVQIPEVVDLGDESTQAHGSTRVRRPDEIALLMVPEDRSIADVTTIRIGDGAKTPTLVLDHWKRIVGGGDDAQFSSSFTHTAHRVRARTSP